jgi:hypothetical protein
MTEDLSMNPTYRLTCLYCNGALYPVAYTPESAPWTCTICHQAWWVAELSEEARRRFRPAYCDFGHGPELEALQKLVLEERDEARIRKTSVRSDQIQLLPVFVLKRLPQDNELGDLIKLEITSKGG